MLPTILCQSRVGEKWTKRRREEERGGEAGQDGPIQHSTACPVCPAENHLDLRIETCKLDQGHSGKRGNTSFRNSFKMCLYRFLFFF